MGGQRVDEGRPPSNLQCFLDCTTPAVETHILPKVTRLHPVKFLPLVFLTDASAARMNCVDLWRLWEFRICHLLVSLHRLSVRAKMIFFFFFLVTVHLSSDASVYGF